MRLLTTKITVFALIFIIFSSLIIYYAYDVGGYNKYLESVEKYSNDYQVDKNLVLAIIKTESNFKGNATSNKGAIGIMQIMPKTADFIAENLVKKSDYDLFDVESNILFGVAYLKYLIDKFNVEDYAIIAYNAGEGKVSSWIDDDMQIPYKETKNYLKKVKRRKAVFKMLTA